MPCARGRTRKGGFEIDTFLTPSPWDDRGFPSLVARPFADRVEEFGQTVARDPGNVVLWSGAQVTLAVAFHELPNEAKQLLERFESSRLATAPWSVTVRADAPTVPVYFDFEGLWCHLAGLEGTLAYPHGLGGVLAGRDEEEAQATLSPHQQWAVGELLRRPFVATDQGRGGHLVGPFGLPFSQRKMLAKGWVTHRTLLDPALVPEHRGKSADQVVFLSGSPKAGARPESLFATLTRECPGLSLPLRRRRGPLVDQCPRGRESPAPTLRARVAPSFRPCANTSKGSRSCRKRPPGFVAQVDHRYDRLLPSEPVVAASKP